MVLKMSRLYTEEDLSNALYTDLTWRRKEISDLKAAIRAADTYSRTSLLKSMIAISYAHWEGYVRHCATKYFNYLALRRKKYSEYERQIYINSILVKLDSLHASRTSIQERCKIVNEIIDHGESRFSYINSALIDTKSNLNTDVVCDICIICSVDSSYFESKRSFIDFMLLKRRNAIAHGQHENIDAQEIDSFAAEVLSLMEHFSTLIENKVITKSYAA
jgi:hypothetical protein